MRDPDIDMLVRFGAIVLAMLVFSITVDPILRAPFLAGLFLLASLCATALAMFRRHSIWARSLTYWDQALAFFATSRAFRLLASPESYEAMRQLAQTSGAR